MSNSILDPDLVARIGNLKIKAKAVVDGVLTGLHKSPHHGSSIEFAEHKEYSPGDDIRHIDWKAFARFDRYYVKKFEDETNLRCFILLDVSNSMAYGEAEQNKFEYARVIAATFAYLLLRQQDSPGLSTFRDKMEFYIPPRGTSSHYQELLESLVRQYPEGTTDIVKASEQVAEMLSGRNMVVIISDFFDHQKKLFPLLSRLRARKNELVLFHVLHRDELTLPFDSLVQFEDMENTDTILADPDQIREEYKKVFGAFMSDVSRKALEHGINYQLAITDEPHEKSMISYLTGKGKK